MGRRGPKPMKPEERAARAGRDRRKPVSRASEASKRALERRAATLERIGERWIAAADKLKLPGQANAKMAMGLKCLERAEKIREQLERGSGGGRAAPNAPEGGEIGEPADPLDAWSRRRASKG